VESALLLVGRNRFIAPSASPSGAAISLAKRRNKAIAPYTMRAERIKIAGQRN
jgi:hypothetical protein